MKKAPPRDKDIRQKVDKLEDKEILPNLPTPVFLRGMMT
jgi:hypothetical protein